MKVKQLITELQKMPKDADVCIFDWRKNLFNGGGDSVSDGIEEIKNIEVIPDNTTVKEMKEFDGEDVEQWVGIHYENDDYNKEATPSTESCISDYFERQINKLKE